MNNIENSQATSEAANSATPQTPNESKTLKKHKVLSYKALAIILGIIIIGGLIYQFKTLFIVAMVNGKPITRVAVIKELEKQSGKDVLEALINKSLIVAEAERQHITVSNDELDARLKLIESDLVQQNTTLADALKERGLTEKDLKEQIVYQVQAERIIESKLEVTDDEVNQYISDTGMTLDPGKEQEQKTRVKEQIRQQKFSTEIYKWIDEAKKNAKITQFLNY